jgi:TatD DNase family protein
MELFDTHAHLNDEQFEGLLEDVLARARAAGVVQMLCVGTTVETSRRAVELAETHAEIVAAVGIHPNYCGEATAADWERIEELACHPRVRALGETGLDRYWDDAPFATQQEFLARHLALSRVTGLPCVLHMRDCQADLLEMLRDDHRRGPIHAIMHSYTGDAAGAAESVELGLHVSFAGMVTYKKSDELRQVAASVPAARLLVETDAPYLSPHPHRSVRPNEPAMMIHTAECLAQVRGVSLAELARQTTENARRLFGLPG